MRMRSWQLIGAILTAALLSDGVARAGKLSTVPSDRSIITWRSGIAGDLRGVVINPTTPPSEAKLPVVIYMTRLPVPRLGTESDEAIFNDLRAAGYLVLVLDYANHPAAGTTRLSADFLKLREDVGGKQPKLLADHKVDVDRIFPLIEGYRLRRDVAFAQDGTRTLAMDVRYPSRPAEPVPMLIEFSCDNANRMGNGSILFCRDTLLDGGMLAGFAVAMADHPVAPPYKGIDDPMPEALERARAAAAALRVLSDEIGGNGKVGAIGFSRGATFAAMLAATGQVDAALVYGNRFDYLRLRPDDKMVARFEKAWGPLDANRERWATHGAIHHLTADASPMYLNTSDAEEVAYREGLAQLAEALKARSVEHVYRVDQDGRGHRMTTDPAALAEIYSFFRKHLD